MIQVNAMGDACPLPVVKTLNAIRELPEGGTVQTLVDNPVAVQNLTRLAESKGYGIETEQLEEHKFQVTLTVGKADEGEAPAPACCVPTSGGTVVAISSATMGEGSEELGKTLLKGFLYALLQQQTLPQTMLFYNGGAALTCDGSASLEDLRELERRGVEILTCGTCLNYYGLTEKLQVGSVTNMYVIAEKLTSAARIVKP